MAREIWGDPKTTQNKERDDDDENYIKYSF